MVLQASVSHVDRLRRHGERLAAMAIAAADRQGAVPYAQGRFTRTVRAVLLRPGLPLDGRFLSSPDWCNGRFF